MRSFILFTIGVLSVAPLSSQPGGNAERKIRASIAGSQGDTGKCTIEVDVDDVAIVEVFQDQGRLVTLSGQPAEWRRMQCSQPLPVNPVDFRFQGIDGRGHVTLQSDPRQNRGVAVVRIEDPKGGREGYTFDLIWRNSSYGPANDQPNQGYRAPVNPTPIPGYADNRDRDRRWETVVVSCSSDNGRRRSCGADTSRGVLLLRPLGPAECRLSVTWGYDQRGIWVDRGCSAEFEVAR